MLFRKFLIISISIFLNSTISSAQVEDTSIEELLLEQLSEELGDDIDVSEILERLSYYTKNPLNLNTATEADLSNLIFLSPQQIENIIYHKKVSGDFISILELQGITGLSLQTILLLRNFVTVNQVMNLKNLTLKEIIANDEQILMVRYGRILEKQRGYEIKDALLSRYLGDPNRYALRYRWNYDNKIKVSVNMKKDAGEPFFYNKQRYGFDFYSAHIEFNKLNKSVSKLVIGDYALQFGQGLVVWNGLSFGKGVWIGAVARQGAGLKGYSSLNENNYQRGISAEIELGKWKWTPFIAYNSLSGNLQKSDTTENTITTISSTGLHRTPTELSYRNQIKQIIYGSNISYRYKRWKLGITYMGLQFNGRKLKATNVRNIFDFEGKSLHQLGVSYQTTYRNYYIFGETAYSFNGAYATINGIIASLHPTLSLFTTYRNYARDYHSFYAQSLSEGSTVANESGIYAGFVLHPNRKIEWVNYVDIFRFPWLKFRVDAPSQGTDFLSQLTYSWYKKGKIAIRYRHRLRQENINLPQFNTNVLGDINRNQLRFDYQYRWNDTWNMRSRIELALFNKEANDPSKGLLVYQDIFWKGLRKLQLNTRVAYFNTTDFNSRIFAFENDVLYASSFPIYYDKGYRTYLNIRWRIAKALDFWTRYALTYYINRESVGSGLDVSNGNIRSDIKFQMRWQW